MGKGREFLESIYALDDDGDVRSFYDEAAGDYDEILLAQVGYASPTVCAHIMARFLSDREAALIDLGCGTGLAGEALAVEPGPGIRIITDRRSRDSTASHSTGRASAQRRSRVPARAPPLSARRRPARRCRRCGGAAAAAGRPPQT